MSEILIQARKKVLFNVQDLSHLIWDGEQNYQRLKSFEQLVQNDAILRYDPRQLAIGREELYNLYCLKAKRVLEIAPLKDIQDFATQVFPEALASSLNFQMFMPTIQTLGTPEQVKLFYEPARRWEIIGCYAQTEMAHGSDVNGFQTTATFDQQTQEFIINTPNIGATKWWGSDMGLTSTHALTQAVLYVNNISYGVQNFIVPIRDLKTHLPLPGIEVGDIGAKFGYNAKDNGYLSFSNIRIPLVNMLSKYTQVDSNGKVSKHGNDKIWHATMQKSRQHFLDLSWKALGASLTIIVRYSLQRTQFMDKSGVEIPIMNYQVQQARILPMIAEMYANMFGSKRVLQLAQQNVKLIEENADYSMMNELHVILCAAKSFYTWNTFFGLERLRQCAGGHGYSIYSGLPQILTEFATCVAAEGDNTVLSLSSAKAVLSFLSTSLLSGKAPNSTLDYMENIVEYVSSVKAPIVDRKDIYDTRVLASILRYNVACNVMNAGQRLQGLIRDGLSFKSATDFHMGIILNEVSRTQSNYWTIRTFCEELDHIQSPEIKQVLQRVCVLYGLMKIIESQSQLFEYGIMQSHHFKWVKEIRDEILPFIKDQAIGLTEAVGFANETLRTAIGRDDGQMYETLFKWASEYNPVNDPEFQEEMFQKMKQQRMLLSGPKI